MRRTITTLMVVTLMTPAAAAAGSLDPPPGVPTRAERNMDRSSYVEPANRWKAYIKQHGESAEARRRMHETVEALKQRVALRPRKRSASHE